MNVGTSVSRVGGSAQVKAMRQVSGSLRVDLAQFRDLEAFAAFASDLDDASKAQLARGQRMVELLKQAPVRARTRSRTRWSRSGSAPRASWTRSRPRTCAASRREFLDLPQVRAPGVLQSIAATNDKLSDDTVGLLRSRTRSTQFKNAASRLGDGTLLRGDDAVTPARSTRQVGQETITRHAKG